MASGFRAVLGGAAEGVSQKTSQLAAAETNSNPARCSHAPAYRLPGMARA
jgi:hypothetical protein